jgi:hypothetical protein
MSTMLSLDQVGIGLRYSNGQRLTSLALLYPVTEDSKLEMESPDYIVRTA